MLTGENNNANCKQYSARPKVNIPIRFQDETSVELDALLPSILDKAFKGQL